MKKENIVVIVVMIAIIAMEGVFFSISMIIKYYPKLAYDVADIFDALKKLVNPPLSLEELEKVEPVRGKIAFESGGQIYIINTDGSNPTVLIEGTHPSWSPDGKKIAFTKGSNVEGIGIHIYVMSARGGKPIQLTYNRSTVDEYPAWSPDGKKIAFASAPLKGTSIGKYDIYVINIDGSNLTRLTKEGGWDPCWSPDGKKIAFVSNRDGSVNIYIMNADGSNVTQITKMPHYFEWVGSNGVLKGTIEVPAHPSWSPDGKRIVFSVWFTDRQIAIINVDGSNLTLLTDSTEFKNDWPKWSPDGKKIAFASTRNGNWDIYVMDASGTNLKRLTDNPAHDCYPSWSPP
jgi:Tol biopolymer transport system component